MDATIDGVTPFQVLPADKVRVIIHNIAECVLVSSGILYILDIFNLLPWDTTPYNSIKERFGDDYYDNLNMKNRTNTTFHS